MKRFLIALSLLVAHAAGFALPTLDAVQAEIQRGHYTQAEDMMREVVTAKPGSARAHYVYAELLAHDRRFSQAAEEAALARRLDPDLRFTQPEKFNAFTRLLEREQATARATDRTALSLPRAAAPVQTRPASGVPGWVWGVVGLGALALLAWRALGTSRQGLAASAAAPLSAGSAPPAYAPAVPPAAGGSGLLGTGLAAAGGVAAGMLVEKWLEGRHEPQVLEVRQDPAPFASGLFGLDSSSDTAARELEQRPIDMGSGNGWDDGGRSTDNSDGW